MIKNISLIVLVGLLGSGCSYKQPVPVTIEKLSPQASKALVISARNSVVSEPVSTAVVAAKNADIDPVSEAVEQMSEQLINGLSRNKVKRFPIAVLPFASLRHSVPDSLFGARLSESFIFPLQQRGYNLVDYRAVSLSTTVKSPVSKRNISALRQRYKIYFVLTGTYAHHPDGIVINARILDTTTRQVLAAAQTHIPNQRLEGGLPGFDPVKALNNGYIIENGSAPQRVVK
ncbi:FlgO family outer membrane protein [Neptunomonas sp.]|uniref:FlgO family outer membrane protein n=1 Tax=Neptunomonas sp. TaxID=1971898 RepID=UPI0025F0C1B8|nr:FlgO family outer membrane protein [Neptunomonas sp.]